MPRLRSFFNRQSSLPANIPALRALRVKAKAFEIFFRYQFVSTTYFYFLVFILLQKILENNWKSVSPWGAKILVEDVLVIYTKAS